VSEQRFTATIATSGNRIFLAIPFDPNAIWGVKQRHHITGSINGCPSVIRLCAGSRVPGVRQHARLGLLR
jgi:hypothetical protein